MTVLWITGLSGAGKTTLAKAFVAQHTKPIIRLDGDELREVMDATTVHTKEERLKLAMRYSKLCRLLSLQGFDVIIATISLFHEVQDWNRQNIPGYTEIFLDVSMDELQRRDSKKIYSTQKNIAGLDLAIERPKNPDIHITWDKEMTVEKALQILKKELNL